MRRRISLLVYKFDVSLIYNVSNITIKKKKLCQNVTFWVALKN